MRAWLIRYRERRAAKLLLRAQRRHALRGFHGQDVGGSAGGTPGTSPPGLQTGLGNPDPFPPAT